MSSVLNAFNTLTLVCFDIRKAGLSGERLSSAVPQPPSLWQTLKAMVTCNCRNVLNANNYIL